MLTVPCSYDTKSLMRTEYVFAMQVMNGLRHSGLAARQRAASRSSNNSNHGGGTSRRTVTSSAAEQSAQRGRKKRSRTQLRLPPQGRKVGLEPKGDE